MTTQENKDQNTQENKELHLTNQNPPHPTHYTNNPNGTTTYYKSTITYHETDQHGNPTPNGQTLTKTPGTTVTTHPNDTKTITCTPTNNPNGTTTKTTQKNKTNK